MDPTLQAIEQSALATAIRDSLFLFPLIETLHVFALALVFGTIVLVDLRLLGLSWTERSVRQVEADTLKWTWIGFVAAAITGGLMFTTNAAVYLNSLPFKLKLVALVLAGVNMVVFEFTTHRRIDAWDNGGRAPQGARVAAALSLALWLAVIVTGRWIGFTTSHAPQGAPPPPPNVNFDDFLK